MKEAAYLDLPIKVTSDQYPDTKILIYADRFENGMIQTTAHGYIVIPKPTITDLELNRPASKTVTKNVFNLPLDVNEFKWQEPPKQDNRFVSFFKTLGNNIRKLFTKVED